MKPHQFIVHWVPGFVVTLFVAGVICEFCNCSLRDLFRSDPLLLLAVAALIVGQLVDAIRNTWIETFLDKRGRRRPINWDFFFKCKNQRLENLENYFYVYYVFDVNILIAFFMIMAVCVVGTIIIIGCWFLGNPLAERLISDIYHADRREWVMSLVLSVSLAFALFSLYRDAKELRKDVARFTYPHYPPHKGVYTRLRPSKIDKGGVGVFAITPIPRGTELFAGDDCELTWLQERKLSGLPANVRRLYEDFCIMEKKGNLYGAPQNFNCMTISWYLNHSKTPNVEADETFNFFAKEDIAEGEELTVDERTYNEWREPPSYLENGAAGNYVDEQPAVKKG